MAIEQLTLPLENHLAASNGVLIRPGEATLRISLRCEAKVLPAINAVLGLTLPQKPKTTSQNETLTALWLGPDEWLLIGNGNSGKTDFLSELSTVDCSAVDVSHRNCSIIVSGNNAADIINAGCPQNLNLEAFAINACSRTILGSAEIILYRMSENEFHIECWRSFSDYVWHYLADGAKST